MKKSHNYNESPQRQRHNYQPMIESRRDHMRKDSAEGYTHFETYPQNEFDREENSSETENQQASICPSIEDVSLALMQKIIDMDEYLQDLAQQINIKTSALAKAEQYIRLLQENLTELTTKLHDSQQNCKGLKKRINDLEGELSYIRSTQKNEETGKKSITRKVVTDKNIPTKSQCEPLALVSGQIFNQFAESYYDLVEKLENWVAKELSDQMQLGFHDKIESSQLEVDDLLYQFPQASSTLTKMPSVHVFRSVHTLDESLIPGADKIREEHGFESEMLMEEYEKIIEMYQQQNKKIYSILCDCVNKLSNAAEINACDETLLGQSGCYSPRSIIPPELFNVVVREVSQIYLKKNQTLANENKELKNIIDSLISWVKRSSKSQGEVSFAQNIPHLA